LAPRLTRAPPNPVSSAKKLFVSLANEPVSARRTELPSRELTRKVTNVTYTSDYDDRRDARPALRG
jgi:hypothetical protein